MRDAVDQIYAIAIPCLRTHPIAGKINVPIQHQEVFIHDTGWLEQYAPELLKLHQEIAQDQSPDYLYDRDILIPPSIDTGWKVLTSDRQFKLFAGTLEACQNYVRSLDRSQPLILRDGKGDRHIVPFKIIITQS